MHNPADSLQEEHRAATSLVHLLDEEQDCLLKAEIDGLAGLTEQKALLVSRMTDMAKSRHQLLGAAGFVQSEAGMQAWLDSPAATPAVGKMWKALLALAESAKEKNRVNGLLISQHMTRNQGALNILQAPAQGSNLYGPDGQATAKTTTRSLIVG